jgi:hypothetical protein
MYIWLVENTNILSQSEVIFCLKILKNDWGYYYFDKVLTKLNSLRGSNIK